MTCLATYLQSLFPQGTSDVEGLQAEAKVVLCILAYDRANAEETVKRIKMA
jgi:hypothetical protein